MASMIDPSVKTRRRRRVEYERLVELGIFVGEPLELLDGLLVVREPQGSATTTRSPSPTSPSSRATRATT